MNPPEEYDAFVAERIDYRRAIKCVFSDPKGFTKLMFAACITAIAIVTAYGGGILGGVGYFLIMSPFFGLLALIARNEARATVDSIPKILPNWDTLDSRALITLGVKVSLVDKLMNDIGVLASQVAVMQLYGLLTLLHNAKDAATFTGVMSCCVLMLLYGVVAFFFGIYRSMTFVRCADVGFVESLRPLVVLENVVRAGVMASFVMTFVDWIALALVSGAPVVLQAVQRLAIYLSVFNYGLATASLIALVTIAGLGYGALMFITLSISCNLKGQLYRRAINRSIG